MSLENQLNQKFSLIEKKINTAEEAYKEFYTLIEAFLISESLDNELNRLVALKKVELGNMYKELSLLISLSKAVKQHREIILSKESTTQKALEVLETHNDRYSSFIADIKALAIFLELRLKEN